MPSIRDRGIRRQTPGEMPSFVRKLLSQFSLPNHLAGFPFHRHHDKPMRSGDREIVMRPLHLAVYRFAFLTHRNGSGYEEQIIPYDRRRVPSPRQLQFPTHIVILAPCRRRLGIRGHAGLQRTPPCRPEIPRWRSSIEQSQCREHHN